MRYDRKASVRLSTYDVTCTLPRVWALPHRLRWQTTVGF